VSTWLKFRKVASFDEKLSKPAHVRIFNGFFTTRQFPFLENFIKMSNGRKEYDLVAAFDRQQAKLPPAKAPARAPTAPGNSVTPPEPMPRATSLQTPANSPSAAPPAIVHEPEPIQTKAQEGAMLVPIETPGGYTPINSLQEFLQTADIGIEEATIQPWNGTPGNGTPGNGTPGNETRPVDIHSSDAKVKEVAPAAKTRSQAKGKGKGTPASKDKEEGQGTGGTEGEGQGEEQDDEPDDPDDPKEPTEKQTRTKKSGPSNIHLPFDGFR
jgi:hypothetical protein